MTMATSPTLRFTLRTSLCLWLAGRLKSAMERVLAIGGYPASVVLEVDPEKVDLKRVFRMEVKGEK